MSICFKRSFFQAKNGFIQLDRVRLQAHVVWVVLGAAIF